VRQKEVLFFEKKNQKTLLIGVASHQPSPPAPASFASTHLTGLTISTLQHAHRNW
jgi:hypothetical protein